MHESKQLKSKFHVIAAISNSVMYRSRYRLFHEFAQHVRDSGVIHFHVAELAQGSRKFHCTSPNNIYHTQLRSEDELWHKENLIDIAAKKVFQNFPDAEYIAWIDADIRFANPFWVDATIEELQTSHVAQLFSHAIDLGPRGESLHIHNGFLYSYWNQLARKPHYHNWHPGYAWAMTRYAYDRVGLITRAILGSGDRHMAMSFIGCGERSFNAGVTPAYKKMVLNYQKKCERYILRDVSYVPGTILHAWHGRKRDRQYQDRWQILVTNKYDPTSDVIEDSSGVLRLDDDRWELRDAIKRYFRSRNEDSIDLE